MAGTRKAFGDESTFVADALLMLAMPLEAQRKYPEAGTALKEALAISRNQTPNGVSVNVAATLLRLAGVSASEGNDAEAGRRVTEAAEMSRLFPETDRDHVTDQVEMMVTGMIKSELRQSAEALGRVMLAYVRQRDGKESLAAAWCLTTYGWVLNTSGRLAEGEAAGREAVTIRRQLLPADSWLIPAAEFTVGESLFMQKKFPEAEALFLKVIEGLEKNPPAKTERLFSFWRGRTKYAADFLRQLYEATNQPGKAAEWKKRHDDYAAAEAARN